MNETKKGCVYFFRHVGLDPIKIGYSENESPIKRFNQFKTYAPFGAEIIGFIRTNNPKYIETNLHRKFVGKRLEGEWFNITEEECKTEISYYTNKAEILEKNAFELAWAKHLDEISFIEEKNNPNFKHFKKSYLENNNINRTHSAKKYNVSRRTIINWVSEIKK